MAAVKFPKGSEKWQMFVDYWALCQAFWEPESGEEYWQNVINGTNEFCQKYRDPYANALAEAFTHDLDRRYNKKIR